MKKYSLEEKKLYPKKWKSILFLLLTLVFVVGGIWMILDGEKMGWFVAIFFGLGGLVFLINLLPQASYLKLNEEGFETCSMFRKHKYNWSDVGGFGVGSISGNKMVMFNFSQEYKKAKNARKLSSALAGAEGALHDTFGLKAEELAGLMNEYKYFYNSNRVNEKNV